MAKRTPAYIYCLVFSSGAISHRFFDQLIPIWISVALLISALLVSYRVRYLRLLLCLLLGLSWANIIATQVLGQSIDVNLEKRDLVVTGTVVGVPVEYSRSVRFDFLIDDLRYLGENYPGPGKVRLKSYHKIEELAPNQKWRFTVRLKRSRGLQNPGSNFNYETYLFENRIRATGYVRDEVSNQLLNKTESDHSISSLRSDVSRFIQKEFKDYPHHGVLSALIVGIRNQVASQDWEILQNTGTIHLVAISGLHIGFIVGLVTWLASKMWRFSGRIQSILPANHVGIIFGFIAGFAYALLAGFTLPTRRALIMLMVFVSVMLLRRQASLFEVMSLALCAVILFDPLTPLSVGFWLSFGAVTIIACCVIRMANIQRMQNGKITDKYLSMIRSWTTTQLALSFGMAPLLIVIFSKVSVVSPLANLLAIPVVGFIVVPLGLFGLILFISGATEIAKYFFQWSINLIEWLWLFLSYIGQFKWAIWQPPQLPLSVLVALGVGMFLIFIKPAFPARRLALVALLPAFLYRPEGLQQGEFRYTMLDVGHGLAGIIETHSHSLLFDTGPNFSGGMDSGKAIVLPYLRSRGIKRLDVALISHEHNDHVGGFDSINSELQIDRVLSGVPDSVGGNTQQCQSGQHWRWDEVDFEVLWPLEGEVRLPFLRGNNASCVIRVSSQYGSLLLTADVEAEAEKEMVNLYTAALKSNVLQVPHQGSKTSSTTMFLNNVQPDLAIFSTGYRNRFGHPHEGVLQRYQSRDIEQINTAYSGAITINFAEKISIHTHRDNLQGYWYNNEFSTPLELLELDDQ